MISEVLKDTEERMRKGAESLRKEYTLIRAGRANPSMLERVTAEYYGTTTPINQLANISVPESRMLVIQPWDKSALPAIEKGILKSDLDLNPSSDGIVIRLIIPQLTSERRTELVKTVKKKRKTQELPFAIFAGILMISLRSWKRIIWLQRMRSKEPKRMYKR